MGKTITRPPKTIMEIYKGLPEGTLAELINDQIYMSPSPLAKHQVLLNEINFSLKKFLDQNNLGTVLTAPLDVYLDETSNAVQPDIIVILENNMHILDENGHINGVPDLLVEVLSPGNRDHDLIIKRDLYEKFGVKEYWAVDPETKLALGFILKDGKYHQFSDKIGEVDSRLWETKFTF
ncbi:MAG: Uma2 family endonuclease [Marinoscillum sp.]